VSPSAVLEAVVKRKIPSLRRESNPTTPVIQRYTTELSRFPVDKKETCKNCVMDFNIDFGNSGFLRNPANCECTFVFVLN
jgi:hypothetical protein